MSKLIIDVTNGTETVIEFSEKEKEAFAQSEAETAKVVEQAEKELIVKNDKKKLILDKLGLTADEIAALLG